MAVEGAVRLGHRRELAAESDPDRRQRRFEELVAAAHRTGEALGVAADFEIDDVIDPADSRRWGRRLIGG